MMMIYSKDLVETIKNTFIGDNKVSDEYAIEVIQFMGECVDPEWTDEEMDDFAEYYAQF